MIDKYFIVFKNEVIAWEFNGSRKPLPLGQSHPVNSPRSNSRPVTWPTLT